MQTEHLLTTREVAAILRVSAETVATWARRGLIPSIKIGRKARRFDPRKIRQLVRDGVADCRAGRLLWRRHD
jgi:excisionase family DNA binding protein